MAPEFKTGFWIQHRQQNIGGDMRLSKLIIPVTNNAVLIGIKYANKRCLPFSGKGLDHQLQDTSQVQTWFSALHYIASDNSYSAKFWFNCWK